MASALTTFQRTVSSLVVYDALYDADDSDGLRVSGEDTTSVDLFDPY